MHLLHLLHLRLLLKFQVFCVLIIKFIVQGIVYSPMPILNLVHHLFCNFEVFTICLTFPFFDHGYVKSNFDSYPFPCHFAVTLGTDVYFGILFLCVYDFLWELISFFGIFTYFRA